MTPLILYNSKLVRFDLLKIVNQDIILYLRYILKKHRSENSGIVFCVYYVYWVYPHHHIMTANSYIIIINHQLIIHHPSSIIQTKKSHVFWGSESRVLNLTAKFFFLHILTKNKIFLKKYLLWPVSELIWNDIVIIFCQLFIYQVIARRTACA